MNSIFKIKRISIRGFSLLVLLTCVIHLKFFYAIKVAILAEKDIDVITILTMCSATFCFFVAILVLQILYKFDSYVLKHFFMLCLLLANTITFSFYDPILKGFGSTTEIFLLFFVLAMLSKLFSIYPVFSRSNKLNNFLKLNNYLIVILFIIAIIMNITLNRSEFVFFSFIMLLSVCLILLLSVFYVVFSIIRNAHGQIRKELYFILASLLMSILPMFTLNLFLHFFNSSVPYYYILPTLIIFPLYLLYSFCKFKIIVSESFGALLLSLFQIWNVLMLCAMILFYTCFMPLPAMIYSIIAHSLLLVFFSIVYSFKQRYRVKHRVINNRNTINKNIYDTLIQNNIELSNYYLFIESLDQSEQYKFPAGTFNYNDIIEKAHMIYERSNIAMNQLQDMTVYVHRSASTNAFIAIHTSETEKFKYHTFVSLLEQFDFFMKNYSTKLMDEDYKNRIYLSHAALEEERERLSLFLHDEILQNIILALNETKRLETEKESDKEHLEEILDESIYAIREACEDLFPADLDDFGLKESLNGLIRRHLYESMITITLDYQESNIIIDKLIKISAYRMMKELINNAIKHADAKNIDIEVTEAVDALTFKVQDDGKGMNHHHVSDILLKGSNNGLKYLINQVNMFDGEIFFASVDESKKKKGLVVTVTLPLE
ncbi:sensor histidine kinase [Macrococcoides caseolyticum]|uniref:sensor histidine kinase n=1 Tax=Macrococcoides caseolyticum TaxID=69966 RepID=UPI001F3B827A|nr:ATP-binding protein [Macrococcus caseolyticus]MCE4957438.1 ATP-binding protein [Macrococcus caseolyticus]